MPRVTMVVCDGCDREKKESDANGWMEVKIKEINDSSGYTSTMTVCAYECLARAAVKEAENLVAARHEN